MRGYWNRARKCKVPNVSNDGGSGGGEGGYALGIAVLLEVAEEAAVLAARGRRQAALQEPQGSA